MIEDSIEEEEQEKTEYHSNDNKNEKRTHFHRLRKIGKKTEDPFASMEGKGRRKQRTTHLHQLEVEYEERENRVSI